MVGFTIWRVKKVCATLKGIHSSITSPQRVITNQIVPIDDGASDWFPTKYFARGIACAKCEVMTTDFNYVLELISWFISGTWAGSYAFWIFFSRHLKRVRGCWTCSGTFSTLFVFLSSVAWSIESKFSSAQMPWLLARSQCVKLKLVQSVKK